MLQTESSNSPDTLLANFILGEQKKFRNAVRVQTKEIEKERLIDAVVILQKWSAKQLWESGYSLDEVGISLNGKRFDFDTEIGIAVKLDLNNINPTVKQFCYQFVRIAEMTKKYNDRLKTKIRKLQTELQTPFYKKWWRKLFPKKSI